MSSTTSVADLSTISPSNDVVKEGGGLSESRAHSRKELACQHCRARKLRCHKVLEEGVQSCLNCLRGGKICTPQVLSERRKREKPRSGKVVDRLRLESLNMAPSSTQGQLMAIALSSSLRWILISDFVKRCPQLVMDLMVDVQYFIGGLQRSGPDAIMQEIVALTMMREECHLVVHSAVLGDKIAEVTPPFASLSLSPPPSHSMRTIGKARASSIVAVTTKLADMLDDLSFDEFPINVAAKNLGVATFSVENLEMNGTVSRDRQLDSVRILSRKGAKLLERAVQESADCLDLIRKSVMSLIVKEREIAFLVGSRSLTSHPITSPLPLYVLTDDDLDFLFLSKPWPVPRSVYGAALLSRWRDPLLAWRHSILSRISQTSCARSHALDICDEAFREISQYLDHQLSLVFDDPRYGMLPVPGSGPTHGNLNGSANILRPIVHLELEMFRLAFTVFRSMDNSHRDLLLFEKGWKLCEELICRLSQRCDAMLRLQYRAQPLVGSWTQHITIGAFAMALNDVGPYLLKRWSLSNGRESQLLIESMNLGSYTFPVAAVISERLAEPQSPEVMSSLTSNTEVQDFGVHLESAKVTKLLVEATLRSLL